jgi:hypothetical protein
MIVTSGGDLEESLVIEEQSLQSLRSCCPFRAPSFYSREDDSVAFLWNSAAHRGLALNGQNTQGTQNIGFIA